VLQKRPSASIGVETSVSVAREKGDEKAAAAKLLKEVLAEVKAAEKKKDRPDEPAEVDLADGIQFWPDAFDDDKKRDGDEVLYPYTSMIVSNGTSVKDFEKPVNRSKYSPLGGLSCVLACPIKASDPSKGITIKDFVKTLEHCSDPDPLGGSLLAPDIHDGEPGFLINMERVATGRYRIIWDESR